uniref:site-specific DNA-methyltransferase n=1 Tax=uncultured Bilophila sp. TaxID=529385 RepID=UPI0025D5A77E|nr:site-specific DNA-methyltransferase [uncultured Bilophila sp.]
MEKLDGLSKDIEQTEREKLAWVFPQCFVEGKLDIDKLLSLCGEYILKDFEKYEFTWKGKSECLPLAQQRSTATLRPCLEESVNFDTTQNLYIEGDNLEVLKLLQTSYFRQVKMIYIDPPYNTGNDFVYEDDFKDPLERYKEVTSQTTKSNPESMGRFHTNWLNMMYPRLRLAANLLRDDGAIFISIDDGEQANLRKLCDEVFGEENFVANIMWQKRYSPANDHKTICPMHDFIVVYRKSEAWERNLLARTEENDKQYRYEDERGIFRPDNYKCNKTADERPNLYYPIIHPQTGEEVWPSRDAVWRYSKERHEENVKNNLVFWGKDGTARVPSFKRYRDQLRGGGGMVPGSWWPFEFAGHNDEAAKETSELIGSRVFSTPKPVRLVERMLQLSTNPHDEDIILDFFSGSGVTAHAVMQLNKEDGGDRRFILVQLPEICDENSEAFKAGHKTICEIGKERIRRAGQKIQASLHKLDSDKTDQFRLDGGSAQSEAKSPLDTGFKVFKLDSSNLKTWDSTPFPEDDLLSISNRLHSMIDRVKSDRTDLDVVYEIMLKMGVPLTHSVSPVDISGKTAWSVGDFLLLVCLSDGLTVEMIEEMAHHAPGQIILAENSLADDTAMSNAYYILRDRNIELKLV